MPSLQERVHDQPAYLGKGASKKIELSLLVHPQWLVGSPGADAEGRPYGGSAQDDAESTARWNAERAKSIRLLEVRGVLPDEVVDPETGLRFAPEKGTVPKRSHYSCAACGTTQDLLDSVRPYGKAAPMAGYAIQGFSPKAENTGAYNGRFFHPSKNMQRNITMPLSMNGNQKGNRPFLHIGPRVLFP